jgi:hypothetical protein
MCQRTVLPSSSGSSSYHKQWIRQNIECIECECTKIILYINNRMTLTYLYKLNVPERCFVWPVMKLSNAGAAWQFLTAYGLLFEALVSNGLSNLKQCQLQTHPYLVCWYSKHTTAKQSYMYSSYLITSSLQRSSYCSLSVPPFYYQLRGKVPKLFITSYDKKTDMICGIMLHACHPVDHIITTMWKHPSM